MSKKAVKKTAKKEAPKEFKGASGKKFQTIVTKGVDFWQPEKGDIVEGEFLEIMEFKPSKFDIQKGLKVSKKAIVRTADGKQIALPDTKVIKDLFEGENAMVIGEWIHIQYEGKIIKKGQEKKKNPESYHSYIISREI